MREMKAHEQRWVAKLEKELALSFRLLSTGNTHFSLFVLNRHLLSKWKKKKKDYSKWCEILDYACLKSMTGKCWKIWSTTGSVPPALLSAVTPVHRTHSSHQHPYSVSAYNSLQFHSCLQQNCSSDSGFGGMALRFVSLCVKNIYNYSQLWRKSKRTEDLVHCRDYANFHALLVLSKLQAKEKEVSTWSAIPS